MPVGKKRASTHSANECSESVNHWSNIQGFNSTYYEHSPVELTVKGDIPAWAAGVLYRTGIGPVEIDTETGKTFKVNHWFDGLGVIHRFQILAPDENHASVRVLYNSRSTSDKLIEKIRKTGKGRAMTFARKYDPCTSYFKKVMSVFFPEASDNSPSAQTISITMSVNHPGLSAAGEKRHEKHASGIQTLCSKTDTNTIKMLDPETLEPIGIARQRVLHPDLTGPLSSAHAKSDPVTGDVFNYNLEIGLNPVYRIFRVSASTGETSILAKFRADPAYLHSFFLSKHYVVLCVWNSFYTAGGNSILWNRNIVDSLADYDSTRPARWYVVDRRSAEEGGQGVLATYESDHFYCFHTINAFEETAADGQGVDIVADLIAYPNLDILKRFYLQNILSTSATATTSPLGMRPQFKRFRLASIPSSVTEARKNVVLELSSTPHEGPELPTINPAYVLRQHRYIYGVKDTGKSAFLDAIVKYDIETGAVLTWSQHGHSAGEAIFIPRRRRGPDPAVSPNNDDDDDEDDGILLSIVLDGPAGRSYLLALDPKTMMETGRAELDGAINFGFHGTHVSALGSEGIGGAKGRGLDF